MYQELEDNRTQKSQSDTQQQVDRERNEDMDALFGEKKKW
jgi:hypothetical protein